MGDYTFAPWEGHLAAPTTASFLADPRACAPRPSRQPHARPAQSGHVGHRAEAGSGDSGGGAARFLRMWGRRPARAERRRGRRSS
eukprot:gene19007-biopygen22006